MKLPWLFLLMMLAFGSVGFAVAVAIAIPASNQEFCDRLFAQFMASEDPVIVNRNGWLLYELNCNISRRYRKLRQ
jgi:hypothetical protein